MRLYTLLRYPSILAVFLIFGVMYSCEYAYVEPVIIPPNDTTVTTSFSEEIIPIFSTNCTGCHPGLHPLDLSENNAYNQLWTDGPNAPYVDTADAEASILYIRLSSNTNPMPMSGKLSSDKINLVLNWIRQGAMNN